MESNLKKGRRQQIMVDIERIKSEVPKVVAIANEDKGKMKDELEKIKSFAARDLEKFKRENKNLFGNK